MIRKCLTAAFVAAILSAAALAEQPATAPSVPKETLDAIAELFAPPQRTMPAAKAVELLTQRMNNVLRLGQKAEEEFPAAANLNQVRLAMLRAASFLAGRQEDAQAMRARIEQIAARILASDAAAEQKAQADFFLTRQRIGADRRQIAPDAETQIRDMVARHEKTAPAEALMSGTILAMQAGKSDLADRYADKLQAAHADQAEVRTFLRQLGRHPDIGRPFEAELEGLDGKKISLPEDFKGKVVVIDFWATTCPPCVAYLPILRDIHGKYRDKGVEFIGISLDSDRKALTDFLQQRKLPWIQTHSGKPEDPTAEKYGVASIPSVWVIGKDGKVIADSAHPISSQPGQPSDLEKAIEKALAQRD